MTHAPDKRPPKQFEPPPWERPQFEELQKARRAEQDDAQIAEEISRIKEDSQASTQLDAPVPAEAAGAEAQAVPNAATPQAVPAASSAPAPAPKDEDPAVTEMLSRLSAEEPPPSDAIWRVGLLSALLVASLGAMMLVWGIIGLTSAASGSPAGRMGGVILMTFGVGFIGLAAWMTNRSLKQRGERSRG